MTAIKKASLMLHISSVIYGLLAVGIMALGFFMPQGSASGGKIVQWGLLASAVFCLGIIMVVEWIVAGLKARRKWGWIGAVILFATYIPSLFIPLGIIGMIALLKKESRETFGVEEAYQSWLGGEKPGAGAAIKPVEDEPAALKLGVLYAVAGLIVLWIIAGVLFI